MAEEKKAGLVTIPFRLAFPQVFVAKAATKGGKEKFSISMLFPKDGSKLIPNGGPALYGAAHIGLSGIRKMLFEAISEKWGDKAKWPANLKAIDPKTHISPTGQDGWPIRDGDDVTWEGFKDCFFARASSQFAPGVITGGKIDVIDPSAVFGGLICRAQINAFTYDNSGNKGVSLGVINLQILKDDGVIFTGKSNAAAVFEAYGDADSASGEAEEEPWQK